MKLLEPQSQSEEVQCPCRKAGMSFKFSYPIFSGAKLSRSLARHFQSLLCLGISSGDEAAPKWPGLPGQVDRQLLAWRHGGQRRVQKLSLNNQLQP